MTDRDDCSVPVRFFIAGVKPGMLSGVEAGQAASNASCSCHRDTYEKEKKSDRITG